MTPLQTQILGLVRAAGPEGIDLDDLATVYMRAHLHHPGRGHVRASARKVLRRLGAEGLVDSLDGGETWRRVG